MPELYTRWLLGHNIDKTVDAYFKPNIKAIKNDYTQIIPQLSIEKVEAKTVTTKEYDNLLKDLQNEKQKRKEQEELKHRIDIMEKLQANQEFQNDMSKD